MKLPILIEPMLRPMLRSLIIIILCFCSFLPCAFALPAQALGSQPMVGATFIIDNKTWNPPEDFVSYFKTLSDGDFSNAIVRELFKRFGFQNIVVRRKQNQQRSDFEVFATRSVKVAEVSFRGLTSVQIQQIRGTLRTRVGFPFVEEEAIRDLDTIQRKLSERGYFAATVERPEITQNANGELKIVFLTSLNMPCRIAEIKTEPDESVFDYFTTPIELGALCDRAAIEENLERQRVRLISEGYFASEFNLVAMDVSKDLQKASVRLKYVRGPKTRLEVINQQTGAKSDVLSEFRDRISVYDVISTTDEDLRADIRRVYVNLGFAAAVITGPTRVTEANGDSVVRFFVRTGPLVLIREVQFNGELPLPRQEVLEKLELAPSVFGGALPFVQDSLGRYRERLINLYLEEGYSEVRIAEPMFSSDADGRTVRLTFDISIGFRSVLSDVTILGRPPGFVFTSYFFDRVLQPGQPVSAQKLKNLEDDVRLELMNAGYAYTLVQVSTKSLNVIGKVRPVQVTVDLNPGPLVRIGKIYVEGDSFDKRDRIILESGLQPGDLFTPDALERGRSRVLKHDLFDTVVVEPFSLDAVERKDPVLDLALRLTAKRSYILGLSPGYGTRSGYRFNVDFAKNNLTTDGLRFTSTLALSQEKLQNSIFTNQRILGRKLTLGVMEPLLRVGRFVSPFDWTAVSGIEVSAQSLSDRYFETLETALAWRPLFFEKNWTLQGKLSHEWSKAIGQDVKPLEALERPTVKIHELVFTASLDSRDSLEWPTRGGVFELSSNHARFGLLSDVQYDRYSADLSFFYPIYRRLSGAVNIGGFKISDVVNEQAVAVTAPSSRRATLAGRAIVRGFPEASSAVTPGPLLWLDYASPAVNSALTCKPTVKPIGATNVLYAKSEFRVRSPWFGESLGFAGFLDSGAAFFTTREQQLLQERLTGGDKGLDQGSTDQCALRSARVIGEKAVGLFDTQIFKNYYLNSYISTGLGLRYIISNFASINVDIGFPLKEPQADVPTSDCVEPSQIENTTQAPLCVRRRSTSKFFGLFPLPGAYHFGIGANF